MEDNAIVSLIQHNGKILVATKYFIYDITNGGDNPVVISSLEAMDRMVIGKTYEMVEVANDQND